LFFEYLRPSFIKDSQECNVSIGLGILGMPGSTAYGALIDILRPEAGQNIFISAASGAVGSVVGMLAKKQFGCTVIGSCGGPEKCALLKEKFGFDHAIDYKACANADELTAALKIAAPNGIDMYFENVGGMHFDAAFASLKPGGRIAVCGAISVYNDSKVAGNNIDITKMIYSAQRIKGFVCFPWLAGARGKFLADMTKWFKEGKVVEQETFTDGIENWPLAFQSLFKGANKGKVVVRI
jgi:NADPH-dependent curcumin reductase CurA